MSHKNDADRQTGWPCQPSVLSRRPVVWIVALSWQGKVFFQTRPEQHRCSHAESDAFEDSLGLYRDRSCQHVNRQTRESLSNHRRTRPQNNGPGAGPQLFQNHIGAVVQQCGRCQDQDIGPVGQVIFKRILLPQAAVFVDDFKNGAPVFQDIDQGTEISDH